MVRPQLKVRFQKPVTTLQFTALFVKVVATNQSRHKLGLGHPAPRHQEIPLAFFNLLPNPPVEHPTHNRQVTSAQIVNSAEIFYKRLVCRTKRVPPDCIADDIRRESMAFICIHRPILAVTAG